MEVLKASTISPKLHVKSDSGWEEVYGKGGPFKYQYELAPIVDKTIFKVAWFNLETRNFILHPIKPPRLIDFTLKLIFPAYTGEKPLTLEAEPQIHAYRGTEVTIKAQSTKELDTIEILSKQGLRYPVKLTKNPED